MQEFRTVAVIGLGYVGSCLAATLADRGLAVVGVDADQQLIDELSNGHCRFREEELKQAILPAIAAGKLRVTTDYAAASAAEVVLIAVGTPVNPDGSLNDHQLRAACEALSEHLRAWQLVVLKSTVPPGTTRDLVLPLLERSGLVGGEDFRLAFTPQWLAEGTSLAELRTIPSVVGGLDAESTVLAAAFWRQALDVPVIPQESLEAAEIIKLASNWWIDLNLALANELAKYCALFDVDVFDVISVANSIPRDEAAVSILPPTIGVGGSCLTTDPRLIRESAGRHGLEIHTSRVGREVNDGMPDYTAQVIIDELIAMGKEPAESTVAVLGLAFKNNTGELRATPTRRVIESLAKAGVMVRAYDPLVDVTQAKEQLDILPEPTLDEAVAGADCLAFLAYHREFQEIDFAELAVADSCLVLDGRAYYSKEKIGLLRDLGYSYRGIGR